MVDTKEIIRVLGFVQEYFDNHADEQEPDCRKELFRNWSEITLDTITLLKAQEAEAVDAPKPDSNIGCWYNITHNYTLEQVVSALKAQEPMLVKYTTSTIRCPKCNKQITSRGSIHNEIKFCWKCGQAVKWDG